MIRAVKNDQRLTQRRRVPCIKSSVPLFVLVAKAHDDDICVLDAFAGADRVQLGPFVIVPEFLILSAQDANATVIAGRMVCHGTVEADIQPHCAFNDLLAPIGVDLS